MGSLNIIYTPLGESSADGINFGNISRNPRVFSGRYRTVGNSSVTEQGAHFTQSFDSYALYRCEIPSILYPRSDGQVAEEVLASIHVWLSHVGQGGTFSLALDSDNDDETTLTVATVQTDTSLTVASISGFALGDWIYLEHADDPTKWCETRITSAPTGSTIPIRRKEWSMPIGSIVRHKDYFPKCVVVGDPFFEERAAGGGAFRWDLAFTFRTVRTP